VSTRGRIEAILRREPSGLRRLVLQAELLGPPLARRGRRAPVSPSQAGAPAQRASDEAGRGAPDDAADDGTPPGASPVGPRGGT
jgi:hypothetical protein